MADTNIIPFGVAIAGDVLSALSIPGGNTLGVIATSVLTKKRREAAEILIREISSGRHGPIEWPAPGSEDTELGVLMEREVRHGEAEVHTRVQA